MRDPARQALRDHRGAQHRAAIIVDLDEIVLLDAARGRVGRVEPDDLIIVAVDLHPVIRNVEQIRNPSRRPGCGSCICSAG